MTEPTYHRAPDGTLFEKVDGRVRAIYDERGPEGRSLVAALAREFDRRLRDAMQRAAEKNTRGRVYVTDDDAHSLLFEMAREGLTVTLAPAASEPGLRDAIVAHFNALHTETPGPACADAILRLAATPGDRATPTSPWDAIL